MWGQQISGMNSGILGIVDVCFRFDAGVGDADIGAFHQEQMPDLTLIQMPVSLRLDVIESFLSRGGAG